MEVPTALVVDANILFSFFQADSGRRRLIKRLRTDGCQLLSPDYVLAELTNEKAETDGQPGFRVAIALVALLAAGLIALRRPD